MRDSSVDFGSRPEKLTVCAKLPAKLNYLPRHGRPPRVRHLPNACCRTLRPRHIASADFSVFRPLSSLPWRQAVLTLGPC
jgi:hypothetical protein